MSHRIKHQDRWSRGTFSVLASSDANLANLPHMSYLPHLTLHFKDGTSAFYFSLSLPSRPRFTRLIVLGALMVGGKRASAVLRRRGIEH